MKAELLEFKLYHSRSPYSESLHGWKMKKSRSCKISMGKFKFGYRLIFKNQIARIKWNGFVCFLRRLLYFAGG